MKYVDIIEYLLLLAYQISFFFLMLRMDAIIYNDKLPTKKDKALFRLFGFYFYTYVVVKCVHMFCNSNV